MLIASCKVINDFNANFTVIITTITVIKEVIPILLTINLIIIECFVKFEQKMFNITIKVAVIIIKSAKECIVAIIKEEMRTMDQTDIISNKAFIIIKE